MSTNEQKIDEISYRYCTDCNFSRSTFVEMVEVGRIKDAIIFQCPNCKTVAILENN